MDHDYLVLLKLRNRAGEEFSDWELFSNYTEATAYVQQVKDSAKSSSLKVTRDMIVGVLDVERE